MTRKEQKSGRPENWEKVTGSYLAREITSEQAAQELGISRALFFRYLHRDNPGRKSLRAEHAKEMSENNRRWTTYLEKNFNEGTLCRMIRVTDNCDKCPMKSCHGEKKYRGIRARLLEKVPLKAPSELLEEKE